MDTTAMKRSGRGWLVALALVALAGCGTVEAVDNPDAEIRGDFGQGGSAGVNAGSGGAGGALAAAGGHGGGAGAGGVIAGADAGADAGGEAGCGDTQSNPLQCGGCGAVFGCGGGMGCVSGVCTCQNGQTLCRTTNTCTPPANCPVSGAGGASGADAGDGCPAGTVRCSNAIGCVVPSTCPIMCPLTGAPLKATPCVNSAHQALYMNGNPCNICTQGVDTSQLPCIGVGVCVASCETCAP